MPGLTNKARECVRRKYQSSDPREQDGSSTPTHCKSDIPRSQSHAQLQKYLFWYRRPKTPFQEWLANTRNTTDPLLDSTIMGRDKLLSFLSSFFYAQLQMGFTTRLFLNVKCWTAPLRLVSCVIPTILSCFLLFCLLWYGTSIACVISQLQSDICSNPVDVSLRSRRRGSDGTET